VSVAPENGESVTPHWTTVLLACLATYRLTRFITADSFPLIAGPRRWIDKHWNPFPDQDVWDSYRTSPQAAKDIVLENLRKVGVKSRPTGLKRSIAYLIGCAWCTSIWIGAGVTGFIMIFIGLTWPWFVLVWLTSSAVTGLVSQREPQ
jgi:hypothetical protein